MNTTLEILKLAELINKDNLSHYLKKTGWEIKLEEEHRKRYGHKDHDSRGIDAVTKFYEDWSECHFDQLIKLSEIESRSPVHILNDILYPHCHHLNIYTDPAGTNSLNEIINCIRKLKLFRSIIVSKLYREGKVRQEKLQTDYELLFGVQGYSNVFITLLVTAHEHSQEFMEKFASKLKESIPIIHDVSVHLNRAIHTGV